MDPSQRPSEGSKIPIPPAEGEMQSKNQGIEPSDDHVEKALKTKPYVNTNPAPGFEEARLRGWNENEFSYQMARAQSILLTDATVQGSLSLDWKYRKYRHNTGSTTSSIGFNKTSADEQPGGEKPPNSRRESQSQWRDRIMRIGRPDNDSSRYYTDTSPEKRTTSQLPNQELSDGNSLATTRYLSIGRRAQERLQLYDTILVSITPQYPDTHSRPWIRAAKVEGMECYISRGLANSSRLNQIDGKVYLVWREVGAGPFFDAWCRVLDIPMMVEELFIGIDRERLGRTDNCNTLSETNGLYETLPLPGLYSPTRGKYRALSLGTGPDLQPALGDPKKGTGDVLEYEDWKDTSEELSDSQTDVCDDLFTVDRCIHERKSLIIDNVIRGITHLLRSKFVLAHKATAKETGTSSSGGGLSGKSASGSHIIPKRSLGTRDHEQSQDEDENDSDAQSGDIRNSKGKALESRFACPYFKYNPIKYKDWQNCPGPGWLDVHRVKEHLYRRHRQPKYRCGRCWEAFNDEQSYINHQRTTEPCSLREKEPIEGFDSSQEVQLRSRKKATNVKSEYGKWQRVFRILFPHVLDVDIPSPFYDVDQLCNPAAQTHDSLTACEEYVCREVPLRLRQLLLPEIERDLHIVEQNLVQRAIDNMPKLLDELFREFRRTRQQRTSPSPALEHTDRLENPGSGVSQESLGPNPLGPLQDEIVDCNFDFESYLDPSILACLQASLSEDVQIGDLAQPPGESATQKEPDSAYGFNNIDNVSQSIFSASF